MKWFAAVVLATLAMMANPAWACSLQNTNLPDDVKKELELQCLRAEKAAKEKSAEVVSANQAVQLSAYAGVATEVAKAVGIAAQQLGVAVNDFIKTPAGIITIAIILVKVFGKLMAMIMVALFINVAVGRLLKHIWYKETAETIQVSGFLGFGMKTLPVRKRITYSEATEGQVFITFILMVLAIGSVALIPVVS